MNVEVAPRGPLRGEIRVPGDKSISHRALLINALAPGRARIRGLLQSADVRASAGLVQALGCTLEDDGDDRILTAPSRLVEPSSVIDCGNSGTTMRIGAGVVANVAGHAVLTGDTSLRSRPMARILDPLRTLGVRAGGREGGRLAPLALAGPASMAGEFDLPIASAQVKSALLLAGRRLGTRVREPRDSRDHTERMLTAMGAALSRDGRWHVLEPGTWTPLDVDVPGDFSSATFWLVAASLIEGSELVLRGVGMNPSRCGALDVLHAMGANIEVQPVEASGSEPTADLSVRHAELSGTEIRGDLALRAIDELPVLAVAAACANGTTRITDAEELRKKESDRIHRVVLGLRGFGASVEELPDGMVLDGGGLQPDGPVVIDADGDHRLAMAFAVAGSVAGSGVRIDHADAVVTSYPSFFEELKRVQGE